MLFLRYAFVFRYNLSAIPMISSKISSEKFSACFSCSDNFILSQSLLGFSGKSGVEFPEAMIAGDLSSLISDQSRVS